MRNAVIALALGSVCLVAPGTGPALAQDRAAGACAPTRPDMLGPFYVAGAPERAVTGKGLVISGRVRSGEGCAPLGGARIEWWSTNSAGEYDDAHRATQVTAPDGAYRYETDMPGIYPGRPRHLHLRITAPGHRTPSRRSIPRPDSRRSTRTSSS